MKSKNIVVIGSSNMEVSIQVDCMPESGETILGKAYSLALGGKGANQAIAAAQLGGQVTFIGRIGEDVFGQQVITGLRQAGINVDYVFKEPASSSGLAFSFLTKTGETSLAVASGANGHLTPADLEKARQAIDQASLVMTQLETPLTTVKAAIDFAFNQKIKAVLNPSPARPLGDYLLKRLHLITPNEKEAAVLTGLKVDSPDTAALAAQVLLAKGVQAVVIRLAGKGAFAATAGFSQWIPGFKNKGIDLTIWGDVFNGALAVALAEDKPLGEAVRFAHATVRLSKGNPGVPLLLPTRTELDQFLQKKRLKNG
jgi:ribokinase